MAEDKVISLAERARLRPAKPRASAPEAAAAPTEPVPSQLVWLYCPQCKTLEYTELLMPQGRVHNACGNRVQEAVVDLDARAEFSLAELNLRQLERLAELIERQQERFREYQERLHKAARQRLTSYPLSEETVRTLPVAQVDPLGLLVSQFLHEPAKRFPGAVEAEAEQEGAPFDG